MNATNSIQSNFSAWYCIQTKQYKEQWVAQQLAKSCDEVYIPMLRQFRTVRRQRKWVTEPLFPRYVFARFPVNERYRAVRYTPGVINVLSTLEDGPIDVDESLIEAIRATAVDGYVEKQPDPFYPGEELEIMNGPFQKLRALFQQELKAGERVAVLLEILSSWVRVELPQAYVQKKSDGTV